MTSHEPGAVRRKIRKSADGSNGRHPGSRQASRKSKPSPVSAILREPANLICFVFVAICMAFGGGPGELGLSFVLISLSGLILLISAVRGAGLQTFQALPLVARLAIALAVALPFVQMIPLPPAIWQALPGHSLRLDVLQGFGLDGAWMPLSITPAETAYSAVIALAMLGLFMAVLAMPKDRIAMLVILMIVMICIGIAIGIVQFSSAGGSPQFYRVAHRDALIGFFANKNHMGLTLACLVPLSFILVEPGVREKRGLLVLLALGWITIAALLVATNSRAGLLLGLLGMLIAALRIFRQQYKLVLAGSAASLVLVIALASFVPAIQDIVARFGRSGEDVRINILDQGFPLIQQYGLLGSGLGSFVSVYAPTEKLEWVNPYYVNHLHNDWLQLVIEAGLPGIIVLVLLAAALALAARSIWLAAPPARGRLDSALPDERSFAWAGMVVILMFAAHSVGDYPVRRVGTLVLLVIAVAFVFRPLINRAARLDRAIANNQIGTPA